MLHIADLIVVMDHGTQHAGHRQGGIRLPRRDHRDGVELHAHGIRHARNGNVAAGNGSGKHHVSPRFAAHQGAKDQPPRRVHHIRQAHTRCPSTLRQASSPRIVYQQLPALERTRRIRAQHRGAYLAHFLAPHGHIGFRVSARHPSHAAGHSCVRVVARDPGIVIPEDLQEVPQHDGHGPSVGDQVMHRLDHGDVLATHRTIGAGQEHNGPSHQRLGRNITEGLQGDTPREVVSGNLLRTLREPILQSSSSKLRRHRHLPKVHPQMLGDPWINHGNHIATVGFPRAGAQCGVASDQITRSAGEPLPVKRLVAFHPQDLLLHIRTGRFLE